MSTINDLFKGILLTDILIIKNNTIDIVKLIKYII